MVIFRMEREESFVTGRSRCLQCQHQLAWYDNIPLFSFVLLRGKCRYCKTPFSWQYPVVEFATAMLFLSTAFIFLDYTEPTQWLAVLFLLATIAFAVLITVYDLRFSLIPNIFLWGINVSTAGFLVVNWFLVKSAPESLLPDIQASLLGALLVAGFFSLLVALSRERWMGWGDVWLGLWGGMLVGLALAQVFITLSFTLGAIVGLSLIYTKGKTLKTEIPFAPYILAAGFIIFGCMYVAPEILYFLSPWLPGTIE